jgi:hypothetical protein
MKKSIIFILFIGLIFIEFNPPISATVGISPVTMLAKGFVNESGICLVEKNIIFVNNDNETAIVDLSYNSINVIFENETFYLKPYEKKIINPIIVVKEGENFGQILVQTYNYTNSLNSTGVNIIPTMVISVKSIGFPINENKSLNIDIYMIMLMIICFAIILSIFYIIKRKNKN